MDRKSNQLGIFSLGKSFAIAMGGGFLTALSINILTLFSIAMYIAGVTGLLIAASVFKYGQFKNKMRWGKATVTTVWICMMSSFWAGLCYWALCSLLCTSWQVPVCRYCALEFMKTIIFISGLNSILTGTLFSFTLGRMIYNNDDR